MKQTLLMLAMTAAFICCGAVAFNPVNAAKNKNSSIGKGIASLSQNDRLLTENNGVFYARSIKPQCDVAPDQDIKNSW